MPSLHPIGSSPARRVAEFTADRLIHDGGVLHATGHVRIRIGSLLLAGDTGSLNNETEDVEVVGRARTTLPARNDLNLIRYPGGSILSDEPVVIVADRLGVRTGRLLRGRGNVEVVARQTRLLADEIEILLQIGDGEVRGNVRVNGAAADTPDPQQAWRPFYFS